MSDKKRTMDMQALLQTSRLYSTSKFRDGYGVKETVYLMEYPYCLYGCFSGENRKSKEEQIKTFRYPIKSFVEKLLYGCKEYWEKETKEGIKDESLFFHEVYTFLENFDTGKILENIVDGKEEAEILIAGIGAKLLIKRFGNSLGIKIVHHVAGGKHSTGNIVIERISRKSGSQLSLFIKGFDFMIPLSPGNVGQSQIIDFGEIGFLPESTDFFMKSRYAAGALATTEPLIEAYQKKFPKGVFIGNLHGFELYVRLIHSYPTNESAIQHEEHTPSDDARNWRTGNVKKVSRFKYEFNSAGDLALLFSVRNSLQKDYSSDPIDTKFNAQDEQLELREVAAALYAGFCADSLNLWISNNRRENSR